MEAVLVSNLPADQTTHVPFVGWLSHPNAIRSQSSRFKVTLTRVTGLDGLSRGGLGYRTGPVRELVTSVINRSLESSSTPDCLNSVAIII